MISNKDMTDRQFEYSQALKRAMRHLSEALLDIDAANAVADSEKIFLAAAYDSLDSLRVDIVVALREMGS